MPKASAGGLTGGTGDVNPQWYRLAVVVDVGSTSNVPGNTVSAFAQQQYPVPVPRFAVKSGKAIVMEVLKIRWSINNNLVEATQPSDSALSFAVDTSAFLTTRDPQETEPKVTDGGTVDYMNADVVFANNGQATGIFSEHHPAVNPEYHDLTDGAGHGVLIATDQIFLSISSTLFTLAPLVATETSASANCDILYRFKEVALQEYIGIVQSQQ